MKTSIVVALLMLVGFIAPAQELTVIHEDFAAAKSAAAKENKLLLIDFYTTWCGPCKVLSRDVFDNDKHAATIAQKYVLLKYDAEKDTKFNLSKKYHISSYPTGLVMNKEGRVIMKKFGMKGDASGVDVADYLSFLDKAAERQKQGKYIKGLSTNMNLKYPAFYANYVNREGKLNKDDIKDYWSKTKDYKSEVPFAIFAYFGGTDEVNNYFFAHKNELEQLYGEADVNSISGRIISRAYGKALKAKDKKAFDETNALAEKHLDGERAKMIMDYYTLSFWQETGEWQKVMTHAEQNKKEMISSGQMNAICWKVFEDCEDKAVIKKATSLMKDYNEVNPSFAALDTYANLLFKNGDKQNAVTQMKKAIAMGKKDGTDVTESEKALATFEAAP